MKKKRNEEARQRFLMHPAARKAEIDTREERIAAEMPAWMKDPTLLPKKPPGRA